MNLIYDGFVDYELFWYDFDMVDVWLLHYFYAKDYVLLLY